MKVYKTQHELDTLEFTNGSSTLAIGTAVSLSSGVLVPNNTAPEYLCLEGAIPNEKRVLVHPIRKDDLFSLAVETADSNIAVGEVLTLATGSTAGALGYDTVAGDIDATNGVFTVTDVKSNAANGTVIGKLK